jgi:hypothetical protein
VIESAKERAEVHFSTRLQAKQKFASARRGEVDFSPALHHSFYSLHVGGDANLQ